MEREERCRKEEIIHRVEINLAKSRENEHQKEKEEERDRRKVTDLAGQRSRLQFSGHGHADLESRYEVGILPGQPPPRGLFLFGSGREGVVGEVDVLEVGVHSKSEIANLRDSVA